MDDPRRADAVIEGAQHVEIRVRVGSEWTSLHLHGADLRVTIAAENVDLEFKK